MPDYRITDPRTLTPGTVVQHESGSIVTLKARKDDDTGWTLEDSAGGLSDHAARNYWRVVARTGVELIAAERQRQVGVEGWTAAHDAEHTGGQLALAAWGYLTEHPAFGGDDCGDDPPEGWPWNAGWWKPSPDPVRNLVKAGALIAAEIDRLIASS